MNSRLKLNHIENIYVLEFTVSLLKFWSGLVNPVFCFHTKFIITHLKTHGTYVSNQKFHLFYNSSTSRNKKSKKIDDIKDVKDIYFFK